MPPILQFSPKSNINLFHIAMTLLLYYINKQYTFFYVLKIQRPHKSEFNKETFNKMQYIYRLQQKQPKYMIYACWKYQFLNFIHVYNLTLREKAMCCVWRVCRASKSELKVQP